MCKVSGCDRRSDYVRQDVCQKHYFRFMRNGSYDKKITSRNYRYTTPNGYQRIYEPESPICNGDGYVFEHRHVVYGIYGEDLPDCEFCGKPLSWHNAHSTHIDHINNDKSDNRAENLRPLCNGCNVGRTERAESPQLIKLTACGETKSLSEWCADHRVLVSRNCIMQRIKRGLSDYDSLFSVKLTHNRKA